MIILLSEEDRQYAESLERLAAFSRSAAASAINSGARSLSFDAKLIFFETLEDPLALPASPAAILSQHLLARFKEGLSPHSGEAGASASLLGEGSIAFVLKASEAYANSPKSGLALLGALRNLGVQSILAFERASLFETASARGAPQVESLFATYLSYGFFAGQQVELAASEKGEPLPSMHLTNFGYDISRYNFKRAWNNARFWANPEQFDRNRW